MKTFSSNSVNTIRHHYHTSSRKRYPVISAISLLAASLMLANCGGSSSSDKPEPDPIVNTTSTGVLKSNASGNIGSSLDITLNSVSRVTSGDDGSEGGDDDPSESGIGALWSDDAQSLIDTTLDLSSEENTIRDGTRITIDPDDAAVCAEELVDMSTDQQEFQRCQILVSDMLVQIDASSDDAGTMTYLFENQPLAIVGYGPNSNSFELNLATLKSLVDAEDLLNPDTGDESPLDTIQGAIRLSATATNATSGQEAGSVAVEVSQPIAIASADTGTTLTLGNGKIFGMTADAATESASLELAVGALQASAEDEGSVSSIDMSGLTAIIEFANDSDILTVRNLGVGRGPLRVALDNTDVLNLGLDTLGFSVQMEDGVITLDGALNLSVLIREIFEDNTVSDTLFSMLEMTAPAGTQIADQFNDSLMVSSGGPFNYSLTTQDENGNPLIDQLTVNAGQCADDVGESDSDLQIVSCQ